MAESLVSSIAEGVLQKLGSVAFQQIALAWGATTELNKLKASLTTINAVLLDAEEKPSKSRELRAWIERLRDVCGTANDVLDYVEAVDLQWQLNKRSVKRKVRHFFSSSNPLIFRWSMGLKIKHIRETLNQIEADKDAFHLVERDENRRFVHMERETSSFLNVSNVFGRDQDKADIIKHLIVPKRDDFLGQFTRAESIDVIVIVGIGGLGKTTLAKMVYNDERVVRNFDLRMWVCVLEDFDLKKLIANILKIATDDTNCDNLNMEQLQGRLRRTLSAQKYLLILDDVWNENGSKWRDLRDLLMCGAKESKIIVTTRSQRVASITDPTYKHDLRGLPPNDSLALLMKSAFGERQMEQYQYLVEIGKDIANKCRGVPLAITTLGSLLYLKTEEEDWCFVRDNGIWNLEQTETSILPVLKLSYDNLPSYLKQCFVVCSIFPKDYDFHIEELIYIWMALGLLESSNRNMECEAIGKSYFMELWSRSFFQDVEETSFYYKFKMHDLMHDLALSLTKSECLILSEDTPNVPNEKVRHISFCNKNLVREGFPSLVLQLKNLRTIRLEGDIGAACNKTFAGICISRFKCLRMLDLSKSDFEELPKSIGGLTYLRYLDLTGNTTIISLPNSLCKLQCLQTLKLLGCTRLEKLPRKMGNLISLRRLLLTTQVRCLSGTGVGSLTSLRSLSISKCDNLEYMFDDMIGMRRSLTGLRTLVISACQSLVSLPQGLRYLTTLENLHIEDCEQLDLMMDEEDIVQGGDSLRSLRYLSIKQLPNLEALPRWLLQGAATTLKHISIANCCRFTTLPEDVKSLHKLWIVDCPKVTSLPEETNGLIARLREIKITRCPELTGRCLGEEWHKISRVPDIYLNGVKI